ncbi:glycoside hydrolase family 28 protein [Neiella sp. HB171785]|uniref:Glycoside hydrolase family 28 protein n=1 Tax=Neiella litorisoli TaxID=2771431 RepID=A0A8J6QI93_9GAMM|nr:glycoside hydrolase family 28 protein [Neiella litorisoli]MBD1389007.1 glycoside hydrolase family 28 protein [Neiella litorisoli]
MKFSRRELLKGCFASAAMVGIPACLSTSPTNRTPSKLVDDWETARQIRANIQLPEFPDRDFPLTDYFQGPQPEDCTEVFAKAIKACHQAGGGRVVVAPGLYHTGPIHLLSNVNLHLQAGARVKFIPEPKRYLPAVHTRWEGMEIMGYSPLIYAYQQNNIAVTGSGVFDGSGDNQTWWPWKGPHKEAHWDIIPDQDQAPARMQLMKDVENHVPQEQRLYAEGSFLRPSFFQPYECQRVLVEGVTFKDSPFWLVHPVLCQHVSVKGVQFLSHGPNSDGCDPECCDHVLIEDCMFDTGDDCIAIKSGRNADGRRVGIPSKNIIIANCQMKEGHGGVVIGSEISGGVNNVYVENCQMDSPHLERAIRIKTNSIRGGLIERLRYRNITVGSVKTAVVINFFYEEGDAGSFDPTVRDIVIENMTCNDISLRAFNLQGFPRKPIEDIHFIDCHFGNAQNPSIFKNIKNITMNNVTVNGIKIDPQSL